jgi:hypothetical protein
MFSRLDRTQRIYLTIICEIQEQFLHHSFIRFFSVENICHTWHVENSLRDHEQPKIMCTHLLRTFDSANAIKVFDNQ